MHTVPEILNAWRQELPDLPLKPKEISLRLNAVARQLDDIKRQCCASVDLNPRFFGLLAALRRSGAPYELTPGQISTSMLMTTGGLTDLLNHAQKKDLIKRTKDREDRRVVRIRLTKKGKRLIEGALERQLKMEARLFDPLNATESRELVQLLIKILPQDNPFDTP